MFSLKSLDTSSREIRSHGRRYVQTMFKSSGISKTDVDHEREEDEEEVEVDEEIEERENEKLRAPPIASMCFFFNSSLKLS